MATNFKKMVYLTEANRSEYGFPFPISDEANLRVFIQDPLDGEQVPLFLETDYLVSGVGQNGNGQIQLTASGLSKALEGLKLFLKEGLAYQCKCISGEKNSLDLSFEEQWTGAYDRTDGDRKIYEKTIHLGTMPSISGGHGFKSVSHNISGIRHLWIERGWMNWIQNSAKCATTLPTSHNTIGFINYLSATEQAVSITNWSDMWSQRNVDCYCTLRYTKN